MERAELNRLLGGTIAAQTARRIMISESEPRKFMAAFSQALAGEADIFLCDPKWGAVERSQLDALLRTPTTGKLMPTAGRGWLMIPTGGTSGHVRFTRHDAATIAAAVKGFAQHFELAQVNAAGVLPLHHVSGFMAWMRCVLTGGTYRPLDWKAIEDGTFPTLPVKVHGWVLSLVPTQLERLLRQEAAIDWLRKFRTIFVGGGPTWPELLDKAQALKLPLSLGYGMTESAAMLAGLRTADFLAGMRSCGTVMPHIAAQVSSEGAVSIDGDSLFRGYFPQWRAPGEFITNDGGYRDRNGHLYITGRRDTVIISGGEKVDPAAVEQVLRASGELPQVVVLGVPDAEWGQVVIAAYPEAPPPKLKKVAEVMNRLLSPAKRPKLFVPLPRWPVNEQGKVNRAEVAHLAEHALRAGLGEHRE
ncbi:MAG TPA: AMP-binding protein [Lacunisphaera sp.]|jgi:O-succinylbenzoic acid--CoA ligase